METMSLPHEGAAALEWGLETWDLMGMFQLMNTWGYCCKRSSGTFPTAWLA